MNKDLTLLVLAAGMGSRFGGLKQIEPVGPNGEFIIDYSIYDAIKAGFNKVVFVIKKENYDIFRNTIGKRIEDKIKVEYAFQDIQDIPESINIPSERIKPLGTAHAIYSTRNLIHENFATINADDFYGYDAYKKAADFLNNCTNEYGMVAYEVGNTLTLNGSVKRGIIFENDGCLTKMIESSVKEENGVAKCSPLSGDEDFTVPLDSPVSMNLFCLTRDLIDYTVDNIEIFFNQENIDLNSVEYLLPNVVFESLQKENKKCKVIKTSSKYLGMTYKEDVNLLKEGILKEIENGNYKNNLWG